MRLPRTLGDGNRRAPAGGSGDEAVAMCGKRREEATPGSQPAGNSEARRDRGTPEATAQQAVRAPRTSPSRPLGTPLPPARTAAASSTRRRAVTGARCSHPGNPTAYRNAHNPRQVRAWAGIRIGAV